MQDLCTNRAGDGEPVESHASACMIVTGMLMLLARTQPPATTHDAIATARSRLQLTHHMHSI